MKAKNLVATIVWIGVSLMAAQPVVAQDAAAQKAGPAAASATT